MASTIQDRLYEIFTAIAGEQTRFPERTTEPAQADDGGVTVQELADAAEVALRGSVPLAQLDSNTDANGQVVRPSVQSGRAAMDGIQQSIFGNSAAALAESSLTGLISSGGVVDAVKQGAENGGGVIQTLESIASTVFTSGFGLVSLFGGLFDLFGGGGQQSPPPLVKYAMPPRMDFQAAETVSGIGSVDYDQTGLPRTSVSGGGQGSSGGAAQTITVNVQTMDARSFLDRSNEIAAAVRDAMLNLNSINDVVNEL